MKDNDLNKNSYKPYDLQEENRMRDSEKWRKTQEMIDE